MVAAAAATLRTPSFVGGFCSGASVVEVTSLLQLAKMANVAIRIVSLFIK
jgi:hypothetical protein